MSNLLESVKADREMLSNCPFSDSHCFECSSWLCLSADFIQEIDMGSAMDETIEEE